MRGLFPLMSQTNVFEDFGLLRKTSNCFGNIRKWLCRFQKSQYSQDKNLTPIFQKKVGRYITPVWHVRPFVHCKNSRNVELLTMILFIKSQGCATYIYSADYWKQSTIVHYGYFVHSARGYKSNTRDSASSGNPNTENRVENLMCGIVIRNLDSQWVTVLSVWLSSQWKHKQRSGAVDK